MQLLQGGKDNPEFEGQRMWIDLKGQKIPYPERQINTPKNWSERELAVYEKTQELSDYFRDNNITFLLMFAIPPNTQHEEGGHQVFAGLHQEGTEENLNWLVATKLFNLK